MERDPMTAEKAQHIETALHAWHEAERAPFEHSYKNLVYDEYAAKTAKDGKRWIKLDRRTSGVYLVDKTSSTLDIWTIKAYGVPNRRLGTLDTMIAFWNENAAQGRRRDRRDRERAAVPGGLT